MPRKQGPTPPPDDIDEMSGVDFVNEFNSDVPGFNVELTMQVEQHPGENIVYAGVSVQMGRGDEVAFIPSNVLRKLADEAEAMVQKAIDDANARRR